MIDYHIHLEKGSDAHCPEDVGANIAALEDRKRRFL